MVPREVAPRHLVEMVHLQVVRPLLAEVVPPDLEVEVIHLDLEAPVAEPPRVVPRRTCQAERGKP